MGEGWSSVFTWILKRAHLIMWHELSKAGQISAGDLQLQVPSCPTVLTAACEKKKIHPRQETG